jgi:hypothetical protein
MSILNKLTQQGTPLSRNNGTTPSDLPLENIISVDSSLGLDGVTPPKYSDNQPQ